MYINVPLSGTHSTLFPKLCISVCPLYFSGNTFCAGYDLKELSSGNVDLLAEPPAIPFGPMVSDYRS